MKLCISPHVLTQRQISRPMRFASPLMAVVALELLLASAPARAQTNSTKHPTSKPATHTKTAAPAAGGIFLDDQNVTATNPTPQSSSNANSATANAVAAPSAVTSAATSDPAPSKTGDSNAAGLVGAFITGVLLMGGFSYWRNRAPNPQPVRDEKAEASAKSKANVPAKPKQLSVGAGASSHFTASDSVPALREQIARMRAEFKGDVLLSESLDLCALLLHNTSAGRSNSARKNFDYELQQAREKIGMQALREGDPHQFHKLDAQSLRSTLQMATRLDALCRGVLPTESKRLRPLTGEAAQQIERWAQQLLEERENEGHIGDELKREVWQLETRIKQREDALAETTRNAKIDASQIVELRADIERHKMVAVEAGAKLREQHRIELEIFAGEYAQELGEREAVIADLTQVGVQLKARHDEMSARLADEYERGAVQTRSELAPQLKERERYFTLARQQQELEKLAHAALEVLFTASDNPPLVASVGFLLGHCLRQLTLCVYLNEPERRALAFNGIYSVSAGLNRLPAFVQLAQKAHEFGGGEGESPISGAPHRDRVLFGIALSLVRRNSAQWGDFPRHFDFDLDANRAVQRVNSDD